MSKGTRKGLIAAGTVLVLALTSGYFWQQHRASDPAVAFEELPAETQSQFKALMADGDREWSLYQKEHNIVALWDAIDQYADAYKLHPRNRDAIRALERSANAALDATQNDVEQRRTMAMALTQKSEYLSQYPPVVAAER